LQDQIRRVRFMNMPHDAMQKIFGGNAPACRIPLGTTAE